jgi:hypothetical protein
VELVLDLEGGVFESLEMLLLRTVRFFVRGGGISSGWYMRSWKIVRGRLVGSTINSFDGNGGLRMSPADSKMLVLGGLKSTWGSSRADSPFTSGGLGVGIESTSDTLPDEYSAESKCKVWLLLYIFFCFGDGALDLGRLGRRKLKRLPKGLVVLAEVGLWV